MAIADYVAAEADAGKRIDPAKVLLVVNSDSALSAQVADYYRSARNLGNHRLSFSNTQLTGNQAAVLANVLTPVAQYMAANGIEAVIAMPGTPVRSNGVSFDALLGSAMAYINRPVANLSKWDYSFFWTYPFIRCEGDTEYREPDGYSVLTNPAMTVQAPDNNGYYVAQALNGAGYKQHSGGIVPWGRVGYPYWNDANAVAVGVAKAETFEDTKRMIDDCIWAEQQAIAGKSLVLGFGDYTAQGVHQLQWYAWQMAQARGLQTNFYTCDAAGTGARGLPVNVRNNLTGWLGKAAPDYNSAAFFAGAEVVAADCYLGSAVINDGIAGNYSISGNDPAYAGYWTSLAPKRGAWGFNWCSWASAFTENLIRRGGAAGLGTTQEPYTIGLPDDASVMSIALRGYSLAEILYYCCLPGWAMTAYGDPLYRPFAIPGLGDGALLALSDATPVRSAGINVINRSATLTMKDRSITNITPHRDATWHG